MVDINFKIRSLRREAEQAAKEATPPERAQKIKDDAIWEALDLISNQIRDINVRR